LGREGLRHLLRRKEFQQAIGILETPVGERYAANLDFVRKLRD